MNGFGDEGLVVESKSFSSVAGKEPFVVLSKPPPTWLNAEELSTAFKVSGLPEPMDLS